MRIVLAHGVLGFGVLGPLEYFNGVAKHLHDKFGADVYTAHVPPIGSIPARGQQLAEQIAAEFDADERVHILAHSMGGLDTRWALRHVPGFAVRVKTLVCIGTPHQGSPVADAIQHGGNLSHVPLPIVAELRRNAPALHDLTTAVGKNFDRETRDVDGVDYRYVVGDVSAPNAHASLAFRAIQTIFGVMGHNDGVVTVDSATRGGTVHPDLPPWPVDHGGEIGWDLDLPIPAFLPFGNRSHLERYDQIMSLLH